MQLSKYIKTSLLSLLMVIATFNTVNAATDIESVLKSKGSYSVAGTFGQYDFPEASSAFDWAFTLPTGEVYQLQGKTPSENDLFGWKQVNINPPTAAWYMIYLGADIDGDGSTKFDWVLINTDGKSIYKLAGVASNGNFAYSNKLALEAIISEDKKTISFPSTTAQTGFTSEFVGGDEILKDNTQKIIWVNGVSGCFVGETATDSTKCDTLNYADRTDWRYPTTKELSNMIVDAQKSGTKLNYINPNCIIMVGSDGYVYNENHSNTGEIFTQRPYNAGLRCVTDRK